MSSTQGSTQGVGQPGGPNAYQNNDQIRKVPSTAAEIEKISKKITEQTQNQFGPEIPEKLEEPTPNHPIPKTHVEPPDTSAVASDTSFKDFSKNQIQHVAQKLKDKGTEFKTTLENIKNKKDPEKALAEAKDSLKGHQTAKKNILSKWHEANDKLLMFEKAYAAYVKHEEENDQVPVKNENPHKEEKDSLEKEFNNLQKLIKEDESKIAKLTQKANTPTLYKKTSSKLEDLSQNASAKVEAGTKNIQTGLAHTSRKAKEISGLVKTNLGNITKNKENKEVETNLSKVEGQLKDHREQQKGIIEKLKTIMEELTPKKDQNVTEDQLSKIEAKLEETKMELKVINFQINNDIKKITDLKTKTKEEGTSLSNKISSLSAKKETGFEEIQSDKRAVNLEPKGPSLQTRADQLQQIGKAFSDKVVQENGFRPLEQDTSGIAQLDKQIEKEKQELISTLLGKNYVSNDDQLQKIISVVKQEPNSYVVELLEHYLFYDKNVSTTDTVVKSALESIQNLEYIKQKDTKREVE